MSQLYEYLPGILLVYTAFGLGLLTPGPNILAVIGTSMAVSRRSGVALAAGVASGTFLWAMLTVLGLAALFATISSAMFFLKLFGGVYLLWLAYRGFRAAASSNEIAIPPPSIVGQSTRAFILQGVLIQMSNPKAALAWLAVLPLCIDADAPMWVWAVVVLGTTTMSTLGHLAYAIVFSTGPAVAAFQRRRRIVQTFLGAFFGVAGFKLLLSNG